MFGDEDMYDVCKEILTFDFGFKRLPLAEKISTVVFFPFLYFSALIGFIIFGIFLLINKIKGK